MGVCRCFSGLIGKKNPEKVKQQSSKDRYKNLGLQVEQPRILVETDELKRAASDVTVPHGFQKNTRSNVRVMNLGSPVRTGYEGEDEHDDSPSIKRDLSDTDLQGREAVASSGGFDPRDEQVSFPIVYEAQANNQFEHKEFDMLQSGHLSDPGVGRTVFWATPKLKRSCSNLERRDVLGKMTHHLAYSKSQSFEDLQQLSENHAHDPESPNSVMTPRSADRVMLKKHSSSQVLPSGSKKLWWQLFLWSHRNIHHRTWSSQSPHLLPPNAASQEQCGYSSDILNPKQGQALENLESPGSFTGELGEIRCTDENIDNQRLPRFHVGESSLWPQNQWVAFPLESSSFSRVEEWVNDLGAEEPLPVDGDHGDHDDDDYMRNSEFHTEIPARQPDANLSKEMLYANSIVQSLNPTSSAAHIMGVGLNAIPAISHFTSLRSVDLSNNFIVHIRAGMLPKGLHTLNLSRNKISTIEGLRELARLRVLDLSYNRISRIGQGLSNCTLIKELYLAGNKISDLEGLHRLLKLTVLDLSFNKVTTTKALGQLVANYNTLQALNLVGNPIQSNVSDEQLRKAVCGLLPKLGYLNKQSIKPQRAREILTDSVAKAALGNKSPSANRRTVRRGPVSAKGNASKNKSKSRTRISKETTRN